MTKGFLRWDGSAWIGRSGAGGVNRSSLTPGAYKPNTADVVGLIPGQPITNIVYPSPNPNSQIVLPSSAENTIYWGQTTFGSGPTELSNCILAGMDPQQVDAVTSMRGNHQSFDGPSTLRPHLTLYDCLVGNGPWRSDVYGQPLAPSAVRVPSGWGAGIHGGGFSAYRTEFTDVQDCVNYTQGHASSFCLIEACWFHKTYFKNGFTGPGTPADEETHSDFFQFGRGKNITVRHSFMGGNRDMTNYNLPPPNGFNNGEDTKGAAFMMKQEAAYTAWDQIHDVLIEHNWIGGCEYGMNMVYVAARPTLWDDCSIIDNIFFNAWPPEVHRMKKSNELTPTVSGNTIEETGATVNMVSLNDGE